MRIEHTDGSVEWVTAGTDWQAHTSSIVSAELYDGERKDARLDQPGWESAGFKADGWTHAEAIKPAAVKIEAQDYPSVSYTHLDVYKRQSFEFISAWRASSAA